MLIIRKTGKERRIRRWKLIGNKRKEFKKKVKEKAVWNVKGDINEVWRRITTCVNIAKEVFGETKSS